MPDYRRYRIPGGTYFFTVNLLEKYPNDLLIRPIDVLRQTVKETCKRWLFTLILGWFSLTTSIVFGLYLKVMMKIPTAGESLNLSLIHI